MTTHTCFRVTLAPHEAEHPEWRIRHAGETFSIVMAYFDHDDDFKVVQAADGSFVIHAPSRSNLDTLRTMITHHEGLTILHEFEAEGDGFHPKDILEALLRQEQ